MDYQKLLEDERLKRRDRRVFRTEDLTEAELEAIANTDMDPRHNHLESSPLRPACHGCPGNAFANDAAGDCGSPAKSEVAGNFAAAIGLFGSYGMAQPPVLPAAHLPFHQPRISPTTSHQLRMRAALDHPSAIEHQDHVGVADRR